MFNDRLIRCLTVTTVHCFGTVQVVATFEKLFWTPALAVELTFKFRICLLWFWQHDTVWPLVQFRGYLRSWMGVLKCIYKYVLLRIIILEVPNSFVLSKLFQTCKMLSFNVVTEKLERPRKKWKIFCLMLADFRKKELWFLVGSQGSPVCHSAMSNMWMNMSME
jgi:hypothetical protein